MLREKPEKFPVFRNYAGRDDVIVTNTCTERVYKFLQQNAGAFTVGEIAKATGDNPRVVVQALDRLSKKGFIFTSNFRLGNLGSRGARLYSFSEKEIMKRVWKEAPDTVKQCVELIQQNDYIYSPSDLVELTGIEFNDIRSWLYRIFCKELGLIKRRQIDGIRTFLYSNEMSGEKFQVLYRKYYQEEVLKEKEIAKLSGKEFEEFATWVFKEYMQLKGLNVHLERFDHEPIDYIGKVSVDISDTLSNGRHNQINLARFLISCKYHRLDKAIGPWYVIGLSGCLREGITFHGNQIYSPRNCVGVILCTKASYSAYQLAPQLGILIFDLHKLMKMYNVVKARGKENPLYDKICMRIEAYKEKHQNKH
jgi:predicted transcriptional regulator